MKRQSRVLYQLALLTSSVTVPSFHIGLIVRNTDVSFSSVKNEAVFAKLLIKFTKSVSDFDAILSPLFFPFRAENVEK